MLHKMGYEYTCPECGRPCRDEDVEPHGEHCIGCKGDPERAIAQSYNLREIANLNDFH